MTPPITVEGLDHIALTVRDVRRSVAWYQDVLGLERRHEAAWGDHPAVVGAGTTSLALFPAAAGAGPLLADRRALGMRHLAFRVTGEHFDRARELLTARGIAVEFQDHAISQSIYFHDPDGYEIEITTYDVAS